MGNIRRSILPPPSKSKILKTEAACTFKTPAILPKQPKKRLNMKAKTQSGTADISGFLCNPGVHYRSHKRDPNLRKINSVHTLVSYIF
jgi:hypothetical protein